jgi:hypothetical protein
MTNREQNIKTIRDFAFKLMEYVDAGCVFTWDDEPAGSVIISTDGIFFGNTCIVDNSGIYEDLADLGSEDLNTQLTTRLRLFKEFHLERL